jgi:hypothetical protein
MLINWLNEQYKDVRIIASLNLNDVSFQKKMQLQCGSAFLTAIMKVRDRLVPYEKAIIFYFYHFPFLSL